MISVKRLGTLALIAGVLLSTAMPANATLNVCYGKIDGVGRGSTMAIAMDKAKTNWSKKVQAAHGFAFANYYSAKAHGRSCNEKDGLTYCRVHANPCKTSPGFPEGVNKKPVSN